MEKSNKSKLMEDQAGEPDRARNTKGDSGE